MVVAGFAVGIQEHQPPFVKYGIFAIAAIEAGLAAWGVASAVGLLRQREWARISMLIFSALLLVMSVPGFAMMLVIPLQTPPSATDPELAKHIMLVTRVGTCIFYAVLIALASFWLYFFNTRFVRDQFKRIALTEPRGVAVPPAGIAPDAFASPSAAPLPTQSRPLSVSIIAWYLVVSAAGVSLFFFVRFPTIFLWFLLRGPKATTYAVIIGIVQIIIGLGLLKLREWARLLAICYFSFLTLNALIMAVAPGAQVRYEQMQVEIQSLFGLPSTGFGAAPTTMHFPVWFSLAFTLPLISVALWFLAKNKPAFLPSTHQSPA